MTNRLVLEASFSGGLNEVALLTPQLFTPFYKPRNVLFIKYCLPKQF